jgi:transposase
MWNACIDGDPSGQILAAWIAKEQLRELLAAAREHAERGEIARRLTNFYQWCADVDVPEVTTLAETIDTWWQGIEAFLRTGITNAGTEGYNRLVKDVTRRGCGFRNPENHRRRIRYVCTRQSRRTPEPGGPLPPQS